MAEPLRIELNNGYTIIDSDCLEKFNDFTWWVDGHGYIVSGYIKEGETRGKVHKDGYFRYKRTRIRLHRYIMNAQPHQFVDHINGDKSDNRKSNLRICSKAENCRNKKPYKNSRSKYKGVDLHQNRWRARIMVNNKNIELGQYGNEIDAARAYNEAVVKYHGEFARLNQIDE